MWMIIAIRQTLLYELRCWNFKEINGKNEGT